jgi:thiol-disulfide isomerase/thioredoxin
MQSTRRLFVVGVTIHAGLITLPLAARGQDKPVPTAPELSGRVLSGRTLSLASLRGKVVLLWFWSTGCAICRDVLPELRANYAGWRGKAFELITVATDVNVDDVRQYERIVQTMVPLAETIPSMWRRDTATRDNFPTRLSMPTAFLIDARGRIVETYVGRIPAEAWDRIAELLP